MVVGTEKQGNDGNDSAHVRKREQREETSLLSKLKTNSIVQRRFTAPIVQKALK